MRGSLAQRSLGLAAPPEGAEEVPLKVTAAEGPGGPLSTRSYLGLSGFLGLEAEWRSLLRRAQATNPFLSWEWVSEWGRSFWNEHLVTVVVEGQSGPVAIAPFHPYEGLPIPGLRAPSLELMGPRRREIGKLCELAEALVLRDCAVPAFALILDHLAAERPWHWIEVGGWGETAGCWEEAARRALPSVHTLVERERYARVMDLPPTWDELRGQFSRKTREDIRRVHRRLTRESVHLVYSEERASQSLAPILDELFAMYAQRAQFADHAPHQDVFAHPPARAFLTRVTHLLAEAGLLRVGVVELDGRRVAVLLQMLMNQTICLYHSAFDPSLWQYSVGTFASLEAMRSAIAQGFVSMNFLLGNGLGQRRWNVRAVPYRRIQVIRDTRSSRLVFASFQALRRSRRLVRSWPQRLATPVRRARNLLSRKARMQSESPG